MSRDLQRLLTFALAMGAVLLVMGVAGQRLFGWAAGPEVEIVTQLKKAERTGVDWSVAPYGELHSLNLQYQRLSVVVEPGAQTAIATGTLDFTGVFTQPDGRQTKVSSLGLERVVFRLQGGDWVAEAQLGPRLCAIVRALEVRRRRLEAGDFFDSGVNPDDAGPMGDAAEIARLGGYSKREYRSEAWFIRSERDDVEVAEDYRLVAEAPAKPVDERATKRLTLKATQLGSFFFPNGLL